MPIFTNVMGGMAAALNTFANFLEIFLERSPPYSLSLTPSIVSVVLYVSEIVAYYEL